MENILEKEGYFNDKNFHSLLLKAYPFLVKNDRQIKNKYYIFKLTKSLYLKYCKYVYSLLLYFKVIVLLPRLNFLTI